MQVILLNWQDKGEQRYRVNQVETKIVKNGAKFKTLRWKDAEDEVKAMAKAAVKGMAKDFEPEMKQMFSSLQPETVAKFEVWGGCYKSQLQQQQQQQKTIL